MGSSKSKHQKLVTCPQEEGEGEIILSVKIIDGNFISANEITIPDEFLTMNQEIKKSPMTGIYVKISLSEIELRQKYHDLFIETAKNIIYQQSININKNKLHTYLNISNDKWFINQVNVNVLDIDPICLTILFKYVCALLKYHNRELFTEKIKFGIVKCVFSAPNNNFVSDPFCYRRINWVLTDKNDKQQYYNLNGSCTKFTIETDILLTPEKELYPNNDILKLTNSEIVASHFERLK